MSNLSAKLIDAVFLVFGVIMIIVVATNPLPEDLNLRYVPDAVKGLTTLTGILVAFMGFTITYTYSRSEIPEFRNWMRSRVPYALFLIGVTILIIVGAYTDLVHSRLAQSYMMIQLSVLIISILFADTIFVLFKVEEAFKSARQEIGRERKA